MAVRPIDAEKYVELLKEQYLHHKSLGNSQAEKAWHSPIRRLIYSFYMEIPYWVSVHLCRHVHAQPYVKSQRNGRQSEYDRNGARQDETVCMIWDVNAEELQEVPSEVIRSRIE